MSAALVSADPCCIPNCDGVVVQNIPGPAGEDGAPGTNGTNGTSAVTTLTVAFTMPAEAASAAATMGSTASLVIGENVFVQGLGTLEVTAIGSAITATLTNVEDTALMYYTGNAAPGTIAAIGSRVGPTGTQGPAGLLGGAAAGGQLKGTYPNPKLLIPNSKGALAVGNGTDAASLSAGTNGQLPVYDSTQALGIIPASIIPITGGTDVAADRLVRLSSATGLPIPLESSKASLKDPGGLGLLVADASTGNARGTDSVDLQVSRVVAGVTAVASGNQAVLGGGQDNTVSGTRSVVVGGEKNTVSGQESFIGGGDSNAIDCTQCAIAGGDTNTILGGTANESFIGGGNANTIGGTGQAVIAGGAANTVTSQYGTIGGGVGNTVSGPQAAILGGNGALADKHGQRAFAGGAFAVQGDCQQSDLIWRVTTTNATITEAFLNGATATLRAAITAGRSIAFSFLIIGRSSAGVSAAWQVVGAIQNNAGTTALVAAVTTTVIADGTGATWGVAGGVTIDADNGNDALRVQVTGALATTIRWAIHGRLMEVAY